MNRRYAEDRMNDDVIIIEPVEPRKVIDIYSGKYGVGGQVKDYGVAVKLYFEYNGRAHEIGLSRSPKGELSQVGLSTMETVIEYLSEPIQIPRLYYWSVRLGRAHGIVNGHPKQPDTTYIHTSLIREIEIDDEHGEAVITTDNRIYRAELRSCAFGLQAEYANELPRYEELRERYYQPCPEGYGSGYPYNVMTVFPEIEQGKVLLVISDFDKYYFHSLCVKNKKGETLKYSAHSNIGMFQDSFIISTEDYLCAESDNCYIDLRYFPHYGNIEFYEAETCGMPLYAENIGTSTIFIRLEGMMFTLNAGERKELCRENSEPIIKGLPDGDLYPAKTL